MKALFEELVKKGYQVHNKRILGDPKHTSEETKSKDAIQELALAIEWVRVNFGIWINIDMVYEEDQTGFWYCIRESKLDDVAVQSKEYNSPQEATEAALLFTLKNLIP